MPRVNRDESIDRDVQIWDLSRKGYTHESIAVILHLSPRTVDRRLREIRKRALAKMRQIRGEEIMQQVAILKYMTEEALGAWRSSKEVGKSATRRKIKRVDQNGQMVGSDGHVPTQVEETVEKAEERTGDIGYLNAAKSYQADIRKLLDIESAQRLEITGAGGGPIAMDINTGEMDDRTLSGYLLELVRVGGLIANGQPLDSSLNAEYLLPDQQREDVDSMSTEDDE